MGLASDLPTIAELVILSGNRGGGGVRLETAETIERHRVGDCRCRDLRNIDFQQLRGLSIGIVEVIVGTIGAFPIYLTCRCEMRMVLATRLIT